LSKSRFCFKSKENSKITKPKITQPKSKDSIQLIFVELKVDRKIATKIKGFSSNNNNIYYKMHTLLKSLKC